MSPSQQLKQTSLRTLISCPKFLKKSIAMISNFLKSVISIFYISILIINVVLRL